MPGRAIKVLVDPDSVGRKHITFVLAIIPDGNSLPWHVHQVSEVVTYVLQGTGSAHSDTEAKAVRAGTVLYMEADSNHRIVNEGKGEMKLLCVFLSPVKIGPPK